MPRACTMALTDTYFYCTIPFKGYSEKKMDTTLRPVTVNLSQFIQLLNGLSQEATMVDQLEAVDRARRDAAEFADSTIVLQFPYNNLDNKFERKYHSNHGLELWR